MKSLVFALFCFVSLNAMAIIEAPYSNSFDGNGNVVFYDQAFILVKAPAAGALAIGDVVVLDTTADDGITVATSSDQSRRAHCIVAEAIAASKVGKCQVSGYMAAAKLDATVPATAGNQAYISGSNAKYVSGIAAPVATNFPVGEFLDTSYASGTIELYIRLK